MVERMLGLGKKGSVIRELFEYGNRRRAEIGEDKVFDFSLGNPSVPAPDSVRETLRRLIDETPPEKLHAYTSAPGEFSVRQAIADYIRATYNTQAEAKQVYITAGAAPALTITISALVNEGEEVAVPVPFFPEYKVFAEQAGARLCPFPSREGDFQIERSYLEAAINEKTRALIINTPNNPSGAILTRESLEIVAQVLKEKSELYGKPIYLVSDEPYRELVYGDNEVPWLPDIYDNTIVCYSYSKSLSLPGERIGYIFVGPKVIDGGDVFAAVCGAGRSMGYTCAPSLFQFLIKESLGKTSDMQVYRENRELLYNGLSEMGYEMVKPDGAFYLFVKSPEADANAFSERAKDYELLLVPSDDFGCPGYVRIAYCVSTKQCINSLPAFRALAESYGLSVK